MLCLKVILTVIYSMSLILALFINIGKIVLLELQTSNAGAAWYANLFAQSSGFHSDWPKETLSDLVPPLNSVSNCQFLYVKKINK